MKTFRADYYLDGKPETIVVEVRFDDKCHNGHNTFAITGTIYNKGGFHSDGRVVHENGAVLWCAWGGCLHVKIANRLPELAKYLKWHLCSTTGPLHYIANTVYHAGDRDERGLRKGEFQQPQGRMGKGKERDLDAARHCAIWPDATDEQLTAPGLEERLTELLPALNGRIQPSDGRVGLLTREVAVRHLYRLIGSPVVASYGHWYRRKLPHRLTMSHNPTIYGWLWWNFSWDSRCNKV